MINITKAYGEKKESYLAPLSLDEAIKICEYHKSFPQCRQTLKHLK